MVPTRTPGRQAARPPRATRGIMETPRSWSRWALVLLAALVATVLAVQSAPWASAASTAQDLSWSKAAEAQVDFSDWMSALDDDVPLGRLSLPGTHDALAVKGGVGAQTQTLCGPDATAEINPRPGGECDVTAQLEAGVRYLDVRLKCVDGSLGAYHGSVRQYADFAEDVLGRVNQFLTDHPTETVLLKVQDEDPRSDKDCTDAVFDERMTAVLESDAAQKVWRPTSPDDYVETDGVRYAVPPTLGAVRGKVVLFALWQYSTQNVPAITWNTHVGNLYSGPYVRALSHYNVCLSKGCGRSLDEIRNSAYKVAEPIFLGDKMTEVRRFLAESSGSTRNLFIVNEISCSTGVTPSTCATGEGFDGFGFHGTNTATLEHLFDRRATDAGLLVSDFPGPGLLAATIALNLEHLDESRLSALPLGGILKALAPSAARYGDDAHTRIKTLRNFLAFNTEGAGSTILRYAAYPTGAAGVSVPSGALHGSAPSGDGLEYVVWGSAGLGSATEQAAAEQAVRDGAPQQGSAAQRAEQVRALLAASFPADSWAVIAHRSDQGSKVIDNAGELVSTGALSFSVQASDWTYRVAAYGPAMPKLTPDAVRGTAGETATLGPITVSAAAIDGATVSAASPLPVSLTTDSPSGFFSLTEGGDRSTAVETLTVPAGSPGVQVWYGDTRATAGLAKAATFLNARVPGVVDTSFSVATAEVLAAAADRIDIAPPGPATVAFDGSDRNATLLRLVDAFGNLAQAPAGQHFVQDVDLSTSSPTGWFTPLPSEPRGGAVTTGPLGAGSTLPVYYGDTTAGSHTLTASGFGVTGTAVQRVVGGAAVAMDFVGPAVTGDVGASPQAGPLSLALTDRFGNPASTGSAREVTLSGAAFALSRGGAPVSTVRLVPGQPTPLYVGSTRSGPVQVVASFVDLGVAPASTTVEFRPGPPSAVGLLDVPSGTTAAEGATAGPVKVAVLDSFGNATETAVDRRVELTTTAGPALRFATDPVTDPDAPPSDYSTSVTVPQGTSSVDLWFGGTTAGTSQVTTSSPDLSPTTSPLRVVAGPYAGYRVEGLPESSVATATPQTPLRVRLVDRFGNTTGRPAPPPQGLPFSVKLLLHEPSCTWALPEGARGDEVTGSSVDLRFAGETTAVNLQLGCRRSGLHTLESLDISGVGHRSWQQHEVVPAEPAALVLDAEGAASRIDEGRVLGPVEVGFADAFGNEGAVLAEDVLLRLSSSSPFGTFAGASGGEPVSEMTVLAGGLGQSFFYGDTVAGTATLTVSGDGLTAASTVVTVQRALPQVTLEGPVRSQYGEPARFRATLMGAASEPPQGEVQFVLDGVVLDTVPVGDGPEELVLSASTAGALDVGVRTFTVHYLGDERYEPVVASAVHEVVPGTTTVVASLPALVQYGSELRVPVQVSAVAPARGTPLGTAELREGERVLDEVVLDGAGRAVLSAERLDPGLHTLTVRYLPSSENWLSSDVDGDVEVTRVPTQAVLSSTQEPLVVGGFTTLVATVSPDAEVGDTLTGDVELYEDGVLVGRAPLGPDRTASFTRTYEQVGTRQLMAVYSGDRHHLPATADALAQRVTYALAAEPTRPSTPRAGSTIVLRWMLQDAQGHNVSTQEIAVRAVRLLDASGDPVPFTPSGADVIGSDRDARYSLRMSTKGLPPGDYTLVLVAADDPVEKQVAVSLRSRRAVPTRSP